MVKLRYERDQRVSILIEIAASQQCAGGNVNPLTPLSWWTSPRCFLGCEEQKEATCVPAFERTACLPAPDREMYLWTSIDNLLGNFGHSTDDHFIPFEGSLRRLCTGSFSPCPCPSKEDPVSPVYCRWSQTIQGSSYWDERIIPPLSYFILLLHIICLCVHVNICMCGGQRLTLDILFLLFPTYLLDKPPTIPGANPFGFSDWKKSHRDFPSAPHPHCCNCRHSYCSRVWLRTGNLSSSPQACIANTLLIQASLHSF